MKDTALGEDLVPRAIFATQLSPRAVYFIQTGGSALSNTYNTHVYDFNYVDFITVNFSKEEYRLTKCDRKAKFIVHLSKPFNRDITVTIDIVSEESE